MNDRERLIELIEEVHASWNTSHIVDHLIANGVGFVSCKFDDDGWYIPLSNGRKYYTSYEAKMKEVKHE